MERVVSGSQLNLAIYDFAFHPDDGFAYAVDRWGNLLKIDVQASTSVTLSNVGEAGTFGAVYFDLNSAKGNARKEKKVNYFN